MPRKIKSIIFISPYFKKQYLFENIFFKSIKIIWKFLIPNKKHELDYSKIKDYEKPTFLDNKYVLKSINTKDILGSVYSFKSIKDNSNFKQIKTPILKIYGERDKRFLRDNDKNLDSKNIKYALIKNKDHLFLKTEPKKVSKKIKYFLRKNIN
jgi:pimeloyl-ACP methyl ester carboxylesterase